MIFLTPAVFSTNIQSLFFLEVLLENFSPLLFSLRKKTQPDQWSDWLKQGRPLGAVILSIQVSSCLNVKDV